MHVRELHDPAVPGAEFRDPVSIEAWDAWFRWRDRAGLHDADIGATWRRVAEALASVEGGAGASLWTCAFEDVMQDLRALPDARVLAGAGTGSIPWPCGDLAAAVNVAAFVRDAFTPQARLDLAALERTAGVCVRMLDNATLLAGDTAGRAQWLQVGPIGLADALLMLGRNYDSDAARSDARQVATALALGCIHESMRLAAERGARASSVDSLPGALARMTDGTLAAELARHGLRHSRLTAVTSQSRLALLANNVADALDPLRMEPREHRIDSLDGSRLLRSSGSTLALLSRQRRARGPPCPVVELASGATPAAQQAMRVAMQAWIDAAIDYPLARSH